MTNVYVYSITVAGVLRNGRKNASNFICVLCLTEEDDCFIFHCALQFVKRIAIYPAVASVSWSIYAQLILAMI